MNWSKAKTILIVLFILTDIFLVSILLSGEGANVISEETIKETVQVLSNNGISIDETLIPAKTTPLSYIEADNVIGDYQSFAKTVLGEEIYKNQDGSFSSSKGRIEFSGNNFQFACGEDIDLTETDEDAVVSLAESTLTGWGISTKSAHSTVTKSDNVFTVTYKNYYDNAPVFNQEVSVNIVGSTVISAEGSWFNVNDMKLEKGNLKPITSTLIDLISVIENTDNIKITKIELGYEAPDVTSYHKSATLIPSWKITLDDGTSYYMDARSPE